MEVPGTLQNREVSKNLCDPFWARLNGEPSVLSNNASMTDGRLKVVYMVTYSNGKIYVGQDVTGALTYFGSPDGEHVAKDFTEEERRDFSARKQILWESFDASKEEVNAKEKEMILLHRSNDPSIGYNRRPKFKPASIEAGPNPKSTPG